MSWVSSKDGGSTLSRLVYDGLTCCKSSAPEVSKVGCNADRPVSKVWDGAVHSTVRFLLKEVVDAALCSLECKDRVELLEGEW